MDVNIHQSINELLPEMNNTTAFFDSNTYHSTICFDCFLIFPLLLFRKTAILIHTLSLKVS